MNFVDKCVLRLPRGYGKLVERALGNNLRARYIAESAPDEAPELAIAFPDITKVGWFGVQLVAITVHGELPDGFLIVELLPGYFSGKAATREMREWAVESIGRDEVAESDALEADGRYGGFTTKQIHGNVTWGVTSLTIPTLSATLHTTENTPLVEVPLVKG